MKIKISLNRVANKRGEKLIMSHVFTNTSAAEMSESVQMLDGDITLFEKGENANHLLSLMMIFHTGNDRDPRKICIDFGVNVMIFLF